MTASNSMGWRYFRFRAVAIFSIAEVWEHRVRAAISMARNSDTEGVPSPPGRISFSGSLVSRSRWIAVP